jgi:hypothetical protein
VVVSLLTTMLPDQCSGESLIGSATALGCPQVVADLKRSHHRLGLIRRCEGADKSAFRIKLVPEWVRSYERELMIVCDSMTDGPIWGHKISFPAISHTCLCAPRKAVSNLEIVLWRILFSS